MSFHVIFFLHICCRTNRWVWGIRALNSLSCTKRNFLPPRLPAVPTWRQKSAVCFTLPECFEVHCFGDYIIGAFFVFRSLRYIQDKLLAEAFQDFIVARVHLFAVGVAG